MSAVETSGVAVTAGPDGALHLRVERLALQQARWQWGPHSLEIGDVQVSGAVVRVSMSGPGAPRLQGVAVQRMVLHDVTLAVADIPRVAGAMPAREPWRLEPLAGLEGWLEAFVTDAAWVVDAEVRIPLRRGRIQFNEVAVSHIGPDSSMGVSHMGVYVDAPNGRTYLYMFGASHVPGARFERRGALFGARVADRGELQLQPFAEALLAGVASGRAPHHVGPTLDRTRLSGELRLGDGVLGTARHQVTLSGSAQGRNRVALTAAVLSQALVLRVSELSAAGGCFELMGHRGTVATVSGALSVRAHSRSRAVPPEASPPKLVLAITDMTLDELAWGNVGEAR